MREPTVARSYAEALFELGLRTGESEAFASAAATVERLLGLDSRVGQFLQSPRIQVADKKNALRHTLGERVPRPFLNYLFVVLDKRRQRLLPAILHEFRDLLDKHLGVLHAQVTVAHAPDPEYERAIAAELSRTLGKRVIPHVRVEPGILGGIIVRYGDRIMDGSLRRRLLGLRRHMLGRGRFAAAR